MGNEQLTIRQAKMYDLSYITGLISFDTDAGHYLPYATKKEEREKEERNLMSVIGEGVYLGMIEVPAAAFIFEENGRRVGFGITRNSIYTISLLAHPLIDLYMMSIAPDHRQRGLGGQYLERLMQKHPDAEAFMGRCLPRSTTSMKMLASHGFTDCGNAASTKLFVKVRSGSTDLARQIGDELKRKISAAGAAFKIKTGGNNNTIRS